MGFVVLLAVGGVLAWLASILAGSDEMRSIALNLIMGVLGALIFGSMISSESLVLGISADGLLAGIFGSVALLLVLAVTRTRVVR